MSSNPLVSVIIPCFNAADIVVRTLDSVRAQTYRPIEIIAVDDCSTDGTLAVLRQQETLGVKVIARSQNGRVAAARNTAIAAAQGEFLAFIDDDDEWHPDYLETQIAVLLAQPAATMVGARTEAHLSDGRRLEVNDGKEPTVGRDAWRMLLHHSYFVPSAVVVRAAAVRRIGGLDESLRAGEDDQDLFIRLALEGEVAFVDRIIAVMHPQPTSFSRQSLSREHETVLPMILRHCARLSDRLSRKEKRWIYRARYAQVGRNVYHSQPTIGRQLLLRSIWYGAEPVATLRFLVSASPWGRRLKHRLLRQNAIAL